MDSDFPTAHIVDRRLFKGLTRKEEAHVKAAFVTTVLTLAVIVFTLMV